MPDSNEALSTSIIVDADFAGWPLIGSWRIKRYSLAKARESLGAVSLTRKLASSLMQPWP